MYQRRGRDSNPRCGVTRTRHFQCRAFGHSATSPSCGSCERVPRRTKRRYCIVTTPTGAVYYLGKLRLQKRLCETEFCQGQFLMSFLLQRGLPGRAAGIF